MYLVSVVSSVWRGLGLLPTSLQCAERLSRNCFLPPVLELWTQEHHAASDGAAGNCPVLFRSYPEMVTGFFFILMTVLWFTREPGFVPGWDSFFEK